MKKTIWLFGDSFSTSPRYPKYLRKFIFNKWPDDGKWPYQIKDYAGGSMDMQTIIDFWIKSLPEIKEDDVVLINLTDPSRIRLSLTNDTTYTNSNSPGDKNCYFDYINNATYNRQCNVSLNMQSVLNTNELEKFCEILQIEFLNNSYEKNYLEIVESLYKITPTKNKLIWSWHDIFQNEFIYSKSKITDLIFNGKWETQHDEFVSSDGKLGTEHDRHLSSNCDKLIAEFFYKKFIKND